MPLTAPLHGVVPPVSAPLDDRGEAGTASLTRLVGHLVDGGVHGTVAPGSTCEAACPTDTRRATAPETVVTAAAGRVPVLAGVIDPTTARVAEHARTSALPGAGALVATASFAERLRGAGLPPVR